MWNHQSVSEIHSAEVLEKVSTYNIGSEHSRSEWSAIGRELVRLGFLKQDGDKFNVAELTEEGRAALKSRQR